MHKLLIALFASALGFSLPAFANHDGMGEHCKMHTGKTFEEADKDKDGTLDKEEAMTVCKRKFEDMDTDHDGTVSKEELNACGRGGMGMHNDANHQKRTRQFNAADTDNDGTLTKDEAKKLPRVSKNFDAIDVDHDGTVTRDEVHDYMHQHKSK